MDDWDMFGQAWEKGHGQRLWRQHSDEVNGELCARWLPVGGLARLLKTDLFDEACTDGLYPWLASRAREVVGIDVSHCTSQAARSRHLRLRTITTDVRNLPFAGNCFDAIVSNSTLDHFASLVDVVAALAELHRVLRPGGHLLLTLDNLGNPTVALRNALPSRLLARLHIVDFYVGATCGPRRLQLMLGHAGFELLEVGTLMHHPSVLAVALSRLLQRYGSTRLQKAYLRALLAFEHLSSWPTRFLTGHYLAVRAIKP